MEYIVDGGEVVTVAVPLTDCPWLVAVIAYEPEALLPSISVVCARPLVPVVASWLPSEAFPSPEVILNATDLRLTTAVSVLPHLHNKGQSITGRARSRTTYRNYGEC